MTRDVIDDMWQRGAAGDFLVPDLGWLVGWLVGYWVGCLISLLSLVLLTGGPARQPAIV